MMERRQVIDAQFSPTSDNGSTGSQGENRRQAARTIESTCPRHQQVAELARDPANLLDDVKTDQQLTNGN